MSRAGIPTDNLAGIPTDNLVNESLNDELKKNCL